MSETYADERDRLERAGGVLVVSISILAGILVLLGLVYATGTTARHNAAVAAAGCYNSLFFKALPCETRQNAISQYQAIEDPATKQLNADAAAYVANEQHNLVAAELALTSAVTTVQTLDNNLSAMEFNSANSARALSQITESEMNGGGVPPSAVIFTPQMTPKAVALIQANQAFAKVLAEQARSSSLTQLQSFNASVDAAAATVQSDTTLLHSAVEAPIPPA
jgi:hypothetical protein